MEGQSLVWSGLNYQILAEYLQIFGADEKDDHLLKHRGCMGGRLKLLWLNSLLFKSNYCVLHQEFCDVLGLALKWGTI